MTTEKTTEKLRMSSLYGVIGEPARQEHRGGQVEVRSRSGIDTRTLAREVGLTGGSVGLFYYDISSSYPKSMLEWKP